MPRPDRHRPALVTSTARLLRRNGYAATGLGDILDAAGATNGSLYHHFPGGKEQLAVEAVHASGAAITAGLRHVLEGDGDLVPALQGWIDVLAQGLRADARDGCPIAPVALEAPGSSEPLRAAAAAAFVAWTDELTGALRRRGVESREARAKARVLLSAMEGALLLDRTAGSTEHLRALRRAVPGLLATG